VPATSFLARSSFGPALGVQGLYLMWRELRSMALRVSAGGFLGYPYPQSLLGSFTR
jgi:hypothetical protein